MFLLHIGLCTHRYLVPLQTRRGCRIPWSQSYSCELWILGIEPRISAKAASALNHLVSVSLLQSVHLLGWISDFICERPSLESSVSRNTRREENSHLWLSLQLSPV